jgi:purine-cytosine permease-like protein
MISKKSFNNKLPNSRIARIVIGVLLIIGGIFGFLPILGFWMIPLGFIVLSVDLPWVRKKRRRLEIWWGKKRREKRRRKENL